MQRINAKWICLGIAILCASTANGQTIGNGINLDVANPMGFPKAKIKYAAPQLDAIKAAGFKTVRFFVNTDGDPATYKPRIDDAMRRDLTVVICLWGDKRWAEDVEKGIAEFAAVWEKYARCFKDYPDSLVFELLNEPAGLSVEPKDIRGLKDGKTAMKPLNAAIPVIRKSNPKRTLAVGGPGFNGAVELKKFVTPKYLRYRLNDGSGFADDSNIVGVFHMYHPHRFTHWKTNLSDNPEWKKEIAELFADAASWSKTSKKRVLLSEWGVWVPPIHTEADFREYLEFVVKQCKENEFSWIYYTAGFSDDWKFNVLHSKNGWNATAIEVLTGARQEK